MLDLQDLLFANEPVIRGHINQFFIAIESKSFLIAAICSFWVGDDIASLNEIISQNLMKT